MNTSAGSDLAQPVMTVVETGAGFRITQVGDFDYADHLEGAHDDDPRRPRELVSLSDRRYALPFTINKRPAYEHLKHRRMHQRAQKRAQPATRDLSRGAGPSRLGRRETARGGTFPARCLRGDRKQARRLRPPGGGAGEAGRTRAAAATETDEAVGGRSLAGQAAGCRAVISDSSLNADDILSVCGRPGRRVGSVERRRALRDRAAPGRNRAARTTPGPPRRSGSSRRRGVEGALRWAERSVVELRFGRASRSATRSQ